MLCSGMTSLPRPSADTHLALAGGRGRSRGVGGGVCLAKACCCGLLTSLATSRVSRVRLLFFLDCSPGVKQQARMLGRREYRLLEELQEFSGSCWPGLVGVGS